MPEGWLNLGDADASMEAADGSQPAKKRVAVGQSNAEDNETRLNHMILSIQTAQKQGMLEAIAWWTVMCPNYLVQPALNTTKEYAKKTKGVAGHKFGSPHVQLWRTFIFTLIANVKELPEVKKEMDILADHLKQFEEAGPLNGHKYCRQARAKELRDPEK